MSRSGRRFNRTVSERMAEKIDASGGASSCWRWTAAIKSNGYGVINVGGVIRHAHRVAWELANGKIQDGLCILHECDNRFCCNPSHMRLGTYADNNSDMRNKGRGVRGERAPSAKLLAGQIELIRRACESGEPQRAIGNRFGICQQQVSRIHRREEWRHIPATTCNLTAVRVGS
jgi:hypothetical protein